MIQSVGKIAARTVLGPHVAVQTIEDTAQETAIRAWRSLRTADSPRSWVFKVAHNIALDHAKRSSTVHERPSEPGTDTDRLSIPSVRGDTRSLVSFDPGELSHNTEALETVLCQLLEAEGTTPKNARENVELLKLIVDGYSYDECSEISGLTLGAIRSRLFHTRRRLQEHRGILEAFIAGEDDTLAVSTTGT